MYNGKIVELIGNDKAIEKIRSGKVFYCLKSFLYIGMFSLFFQGRFGKGNLFKRIFMFIGNIVLAEITCMMIKPLEVPGIDLNLIGFCGLGMICKKLWNN